jgi:Uma2 family endonuclease
MSTDQLPTPLLDGAAAEGPGLYRFSLEQYHQMISAGVLNEEHRVELLEGQIVGMNPIGVGHRFVVQRTFSELVRRIPARWEVFVQQPVSLSDSEPEPDLSIVRGANEDYRDRHPSAADLALVVEVSDTTRSVDRSVKLRLYAQNGISEYWLIDLLERSVTVYQRPVAGSDSQQAHYTEQKTIGDDGSVSMKVGGDNCGEIAVGELLP